MRFLLLVIFICCAVQAQVPNRAANAVVPEADGRCLECICQASSNCDETIKCHTTGGGGYFCGAYVVSWAYWHDAGRPRDKGRAHDFELCLNNRTCAEEAVKGYMRKYGRDCDATGQIDCFDFALLHKLGYGGCNSDSIYTSDYWSKFETCYIGHDQPPQPNYNANYDYGEDVLQARNYNHQE